MIVDNETVNGDGKPIKTSSHVTCCRYKKGTVSLLCVCFCANVHLWFVCPVGVWVVVGLVVVCDL